MAVYKVIQNVEAEDKLLGPLTLKGFVYAGIALLCAFISFKLLFIGTPLKWLFILLFLIPMLLFGVLASPLGREQPTEVWLLSRIKFFFKPRSRIWDQMGNQQLVDITAPKKPKPSLTKDLTQNEVQSRLKTLASTLDTRGWAIKNVDVNLNDKPDAVDIEPGSDRLVGMTITPHETPVVDVHAADDILDEKNNPTAQKFAAMMDQADSQRKKGIIQTIKSAVSDDVDSLGASISPNALTKKLAEARAKFTTAHKDDKKPTAKRREATKQSGSKTKAESRTKKPNSPTVTAARQAVNMELAQSGSAFSVATLSGLANRLPTGQAGQSKIEQTGPDEVTISLH